MAETREFPTRVIASISSGVMLCGSFSALHEAAEYLMGHPIWTHHFASKELLADMRRVIDEQCPGMPKDLPEVNRDNWSECADDLDRLFGATVRIRKGNGLTAMHPMDGIPKDKTVIVVKP